MRILLSPVFIFCLSIFLLHQLLQKGFQIHIPIADRYLDAFLAMPVILTFLLAEKRWLWKKNTSYRLTPLTIAIATVYIIVIVEVIFPWLSTKFTTDWLDIICYIAGSLLFHFTINQPDREVVQHEVKDVGH